MLSEVILGSDQISKGVSMYNKLLAISGLSELMIQDNSMSLLLCHSECLRSYLYGYGIVPLWNLNLFLVLRLIVTQRFYMA